MVDVLSTRVNQFCARWETTIDQEEIENTLSSMNGFNSLSRKERLKLIKENLQQMRDRELYRSKESQWSGFSSRHNRPLMGGSCKACTPNSREYMINDHSGRSNFVENVLKTDAETDESFLTRTFCHLVHNYRLKKFDYPQVADSVLADERMKEALHKTTQQLACSAPQEAQSDEQYKQIFMAQEARARRILLDMRSTLSDFLLRVTSWILYKLLPRFLTSVCLHPAQLDMLKKAANTNLPLIFVPLHRSHLDYILISFILLNINVRTPLVAAGNNLRIPVFGWLLRGLGAFFIKRRIDPAAGRKDVVYRAVLHTYMMQCLRAGHNIEFYIEGGRTRTGKPCMPKGGLLSVIIDAYMAGTVEDALLVPVSVNYDKLVDGNFIRELSGKPKQMETFSSAISAIWTTLNSNYGSMRIDFNQPFSLRELVKSFQTSARIRRHSSNDQLPRNGIPREKIFRSHPSTTSLYGTDVVDETHRGLVDCIARHLIYDCAKACAIMSTNILAFLLLNKYRDGVRIEKLVISFDRLRKQLNSDSRDLGFSGNSIDVINNAVKLLGPGLVKKEMKQDVNSDAPELCEVITPVTILPNVIELSYYSNALLPHFVLDGIIATSIATNLKAFSSPYGNDRIRITLDNIIHHALEICEILQFEFVFTKPCECLENALYGTIERFLTFEILRAEESTFSRDDRWARRFATGFDSEDDDDFVPYRKCPTYKVNDTQEELDQLELYNMLLRPLIDTYMVTAMCLQLLVDRQVVESDFVQEVLADIGVQLSNGYCPYGESSSVEPIRNALKLFKKWGVIEMYSRDTVRLIYLTEEYNNEDKTFDVCSRLAQYKFQN